MRLHRFQALVTLAPAAREGPARRPLSREYAPTTHACFVVQPACHREYFPAVISWDQAPPRWPVSRAMMTIALADGEAEALFAPGQRFTMWADGMVGRTIRPEGLVGYCVISGRTSSPPAGLAGGRVQRMTAGPDPGHRQAAGAQAVGESSAMRPPVREHVRAEQPPGHAPSWFLKQPSTITGLTTRPVNEPLIRRANRKSRNARSGSWRESRSRCYCGGAIRYCPGQ